MFSRSVGYSSFTVMKKFHFPLIKGALITSFLLVFVDCVKELPITLLLRPFNFETLSTNVYLFASDEMYGHASLGALTIVLIGIIPVIIMTKLISHSHTQAGPQFLWRQWKAACLNGEWEGRNTMPRTPTNNTHIPSGHVFQIFGNEVLVGYGYRKSFVSEVQANNVQEWHQLCL